MTDLAHVLPDFDSKPFSHVLPSLEKAYVTTTDLLTLDAFDVAKRAQVPPPELRKLADALLKALHAPFPGADVQNEQPKPSEHPDHEWATISTLDEGVDAALGGGFPVGYLSEITGESAAGKTQLLLSLLLAVQLPPPYGLSKSALYISTEAPLQTTRLSQILSANALISRFSSSERPSLSAIQSTHLHDLEAQDHILRYQVPVLIRRANIGLVVLDSVAANFRAEFEVQNKNRKSAEAFAKRSAQLVQLGSLLRNLARNEGVAVVVANQVLDRFAPVAQAFEHASQHLSQKSHGQFEDKASNSGRSTPLSASETGQQNVGSTHPEAIGTVLSTNDPLSLDHQQRFFTGWGDTQFARNMKTPSLGFTWTNQIAARVALLKDPIYKSQDYVLGPEKEIVGWRRYIKVAFAGWAEDRNGERGGVGFEIWEGGIRLPIDEGKEENNGSA